VARAGRDVLVLEAHSAGAGATGNTTARSACCRLTFRARRHAARRPGDTQPHCSPV